MRWPLLLLLLAFAFSVSGCLTTAVVVTARSQYANDGTSDAAGKAKRGTGGRTDAVHPATPKKPGHGAQPAYYLLLPVAVPVDVALLPAQVLYFLFFFHDC